MPTPRPPQPDDTVPTQEEELRQAVNDLLDTIYETEPEKGIPDLVGNSLIIDNYDWSQITTYAARVAMLLPKREKR